MPDWEGDVIISWNALDMLGINFARDRNSGRTTHVNLEKVRVTVPILKQYDRKLAEQGKLYANKVGEALEEDQVRALKEHIVNGKAPEQEEDRKERSRDWRRKTRSIRKAITPKKYKTTCEEARKERCERGRKEEKIEIRIGRARKDGDVEEKVTVTEQDTDGGWRVSKELCQLVRQKYGWKEPPIVLARRNPDLMPALRKMGKALIAIPWHDGASQMLEVLDRLVDIPLLVPPRIW